MLIGVAVSFPHLGVIAKIAAVLLFIFLTTPIATHMIARAAYLTGVTQWKGTVADEMKGRYTVDSDESRSRQPNDKSSQPTGTGERRR
jgi:multicomponent Na+:H+ antiporter subunit G